MIRLTDPGLTQRTRASLQQYQGEIDNEPDYAQRVDLAKSLFTSRNRASNPAFREVRQALDTMCSGNRRCCYCEDSCADEVEHVKPKDLYPEHTFSWLNYVYACGTCNGPKKNKFAVIDGSGNLVNITRSADDEIVPPAGGISAFIDPRVENPLDFIELDIFDTFMFIPSDDIPEVQAKRADYTIKTLSLNIREVLVQGRKIAYGSYRARLREYIQKKASATPKKELDKLADGIKNMGQPTVWEEMKRQYLAVEELKILFEAAPEALKW